MYLKESASKYTRVYKCPDDIRNFKIRVKIKEVEDLNENFEEVGDTGWCCKVFGWQEKVFSQFEKEFYKNYNNCLTDLDKKYHSLVGKDANVEGNDFLYSYVNEDDFPLKDEETIYQKQSSYLPNLINEQTKNALEEEIKTDDFDFRKSLISSMEAPVFCQNYERMWIICDFGYYSEELWIKHEKTILAMKFDKISKTLSIYPDFTTHQPYFQPALGDGGKNFYYLIENASDEMPESIQVKEMELIKKITNHKAAVKKQLVDRQFYLPPKNKLQVYLFFEIQAGSCFEYSDVYVQYSIDLPVNWTCQNAESLSGLTQTCYGKNEDGLVHFGHCFDVILEYNIQELGINRIPTSPYVYFEVISKDSWDRYRTEGLAYKNLPVSSPGSHCFNLCCFRFKAPSLSGNLKRFFIGDCSSYNDVTWIGVPKDHQGRVINKIDVGTVGTGQLNVKVDVMHQSQAFLKEFNSEDVSKNREKMIFEKLNSSSLIKSVEQVLRAFRKARKNMVEARKNV